MATKCTLEKNDLLIKNENIQNLNVQELAYRLKKNFQNKNDYAIQTFALNKSVIEKKYIFCGVSEKFILKNININIPKGKMLVK